MGDTPAIQTASSIAAAGTAVTTGILGTLSALAAGTSVAGPIGAAVAGALALSMAIYKAFEGCGQTCTITSDIANQVEPILQQNLQNYLAAPVHHASLQAAALNNFDTAWNALVQACSNPTYQAAGQRCVSDRQRGACHYQTSPGGWSNGVFTPNGPNGSGSTCWNWFVGYRDPIANDPTVVPDPSPVSAVGSSITTGLTQAFNLPAGTSLGGLVLPVGIILAALFLL